MNTKLINRLLKRINKDILKIKHEINNNKIVINEIVNKKNVSPPSVIECDDKYIKQIIKNGGL